MSPQTLSFTIGYKACQSLYYAVQQAERVGLPINTHVTINFASTRCGPHEAVRAFGRLRANRHQKWAVRLEGGQAHEPTGFYVFENARDGQPFLTMEPGDPHNVHVHWALHVPPKVRHEFEMILHQWVAAVTGGILDINAIHVKYPDNAERLSGYLRKGAAKQWADMFRAAARPQGIIVGGRRSGTTLNIGRTARKISDEELGINRRANHRALIERKKIERQSGSARRQNYLKEI